jgi:peptide/nickel transport system permease protein
MTTTTLPTVATSLPTVQGESLMRKARKRFMRHRLALLGLVILTLMLAAAVFAPLIERYPPNDLNLEAMGQPPSAAHWLGTDTTGRDVWSRVIHASQVSMSVGLVAVSLSTLIGVLIGSVSGYASGRTDLLLMRVTDMVMAFPSMVIIITVAAALGPSIYNTMLVIGMLTWPGVARLVRGQMLSFREQQFVLAARSIGVPPIQIMYRHLLPNVVGTVTVAATFGMANAILQEAALSFLGLGVQAPTPSWGNMLRDAQTLSILEGMPWLWIVPGLMIALAVLSINFIGDGLRDALDPRSVL